jgi:hypothetical protein
MTTINTTRTVTSPPVPGETKNRMKNWFMESGTAALQNFDPLKTFNLHLCGFAFYKDDPNRQVELHHYCSCINDDVWQCLVFDGPTSSHRLVGIEYIVSKRIFDTLPKEEQKYWHSHVFDVHSGSLVAPRIPEVMEKSLMKDIINTYGKTYLMWQFDKDQLPFGEPKLMMVATKEGQWDPQLFQHRAEQWGTWTTYNRERVVESRRDISFLPVTPTADWNGEINKFTRHA